RARPSTSTNYRASRRGGGGRRRLPTLGRHAKLNAPQKRAGQRANPCASFPKGLAPQRACTKLARTATRFFGSDHHMKFWNFLGLAGAAAISLGLATGASAEDKVVKIGAVMPLSGGAASIGVHV